MSRKQVCVGIIRNPRYPDAGRQCRKWAAEGSTLCVAHGGTREVIDGLISQKNQCTAKSTRSGERCKNISIRGGMVCRIHGGAAKHVAKKARERLMEMVDPALVQLNRMLEAPGTSDSDRTRIALAVLDRTGYGAGLHVEVEVKPWEEALRASFKQAQGHAVGVIKTPPPELQALIDAEAEDVIDAELVDDYEPELVVREHMAPVVELPRRGSANPPRR